jgi:glycosyltransferase involved in cell wall biosynthesis
MPSISSVLSNKEKSLPEVEVLLATFNGEKYLGEFLVSLSRQNDVIIHLRVSDDGSTDKTLDIINSHKDLFESCMIFSGPCDGPSANFFSLIEKATYEFVALADQDDVWLPHHLISSINRVSRTLDVPSMSFSAVAEFCEEKVTESIWPQRFPGKDIRSILTENLSRGCTFVMNSKAIDLIKLYKPQKAIMHDWWILLLIYSCGEVTWTITPEIRYRIHQSNAVGGKPNLGIRINRFKKKFTAHEWSIVSQADELLGKYNWSMSSQRRHEIGSFVRGINSHLITGKVNLLLWRYSYRTGILDEIAVRLAVLIYQGRNGEPSTLSIFIRHRLKQLIAQFTFFLATFKQRLRTYLDYRITKNFEKFSLVKSIESKTNNRVAIVALFPRDGLLPSVNRLIDSLVSSNYSVVAVMNQSKYLDSWLTALSDKPVEILVRPNIGRDFGAYRTGFRYVESKGVLNASEHLLFANDSVLYGPNSIDFVKSLLNVNKPWLGMFVNYQFHTHSQSFFQVFRKEVFANSSFSDFWKNYYPSELRHKAINNGEVALSSLCIGLGFSPNSFVTAKSILESPDFREFTPDEKFGVWSNHGHAFLDERLSTIQNTKFLMSRQYLENNVTHHQGLLASRVIKSPLKLDIFQTGQVTLEGLESTLISLGINGSELQKILDVMTLRGSHSSRRGIKRLWGTFGYI